MICPNCRADNPDGSAFCNLCLMKFDVAPAAPPQPVVPMDSPPAQYPMPGDYPGQVALTGPDVSGTSGAPAPPPPPWATGSVVHDPSHPNPVTTPDGRAIPEAALESSDFWQLQFAVDPKVKGLREEAKQQAPIDKLTSLYPKDQTWYSLYGFSVAVAAAGAVFFRIAAEFFIRMVLISSVAPAPFSSSRSVVAESSRLNVAGIVFGSLIVVGVVFVLCYMVGFRAMRLGAIMGGITALHMVVFEGIILLITLGTITSRLSAAGAKSPFSWWTLVIGLAVLVPVGAGAGWIGENVAVNRTFGNWSFNKLLTVVVGGLAAV
ncbi:MAG: hypothetical protein ACYC99_10195, partial [Candidatus Geothermincolia bacterium]